jgi:hypothetical protein
MAFGAIVSSTERPNFDPLFDHEVMAREASMGDATWPEFGVELRIRERPSVVGLVGLGVVSCSIAFAGCGIDDEAPVANQSEATVTTTPVEIVGVYEAVEFYPACGNETLQHQGVAWYPLKPGGIEVLDADIQPLLDEVLAVEREDSPVASVRGLRVVAPGPGDAIGTLVVWADGVARWVSDSRDLDVWMIDDPIRYNWVC